MAKVFETMKVCFLWILLTAVTLQLLGLTGPYSGSLDRLQEAVSHIRYKLWSQSIIIL